MLEPHQTSSEQSPASTGIRTSSWPSREVQEGVAGGRWCSSFTSIEPMPLQSSLCWWLVHTIQSPVTNITFLLIKKVAFKTAFDWDCSISGLPFLLLSWGWREAFGSLQIPSQGTIVQGCPAGTIAAEGGTSISTWQNSPQTPGTSPCPASVSLSDLKIA